MRVSRVFRRTVLVCAAAVIAAFTAFAGWSSSQQYSGTLESVLKQLDIQAGDFHSLTADLERTKVTVVVNDESTWLPAQQKFFETGSGDYFIIQYKNIARNVRISDSEFKPHWPHGTTRVKPQG